MRAVHMIRGKVPPALWLAPLGALWCASLLTDFQFAMWKPETLGQLFNDMLAHLLRLDPAISPEAVGFESFTRDGRTYTYFGILPALLRLPAWLLGALDGVEYGRWSCTAAILVMLTMLLRTLDVVEGQLPLAHRSVALQWIMRAAILLSGPQIYLLSTGSIYNEAVCWASALAAMFNLTAIQLIGTGARPSQGILIRMAVIAGLALHARASIGVALCIGTGLICVREAIAACYQEDWRARLPRLMVPVTILAGFGLVAAAINFARWGHPFLFADYTVYDILPRRPGGLAIIQDYGEISMTRLWFGLLYYGTGVAYFLQTYGPFGDWLARHYLVIMTPPAPAPLLIPLPLILAAFGLWRLLRGMASEPVARSTAALLLTAEAFAGLIVLGYYAVALRYQADFTPFVMLAAFLGLPVASAVVAELTVPVRHRWITAAFACMLLGAAASHYTLVLNKVVDRGVDMSTRRAWAEWAPFAASALDRP